ncbi:MAG: peptidoglycan DD-metalloendopeptidase family protein [Alistipes sp.]|nr:peptidoglycan DD-metalloendopeptidase family protein [Alistipes sp.]
MKENWKMISAIATGAILLILLLIFTLQRRLEPLSSEILLESSPEPIQKLYGIPCDSSTVTTLKIESGETMGSILDQYGIGPGRVEWIARIAEPVFSVRNLKAGHSYTTFQSLDTSARLNYLVYEISNTNYVVFDLRSDSAQVYKETKNITIRREMRSATINSSLWQCMIDNGMSPSLAMDLSDIYAWSIDFFGIQKGDNFTVIYDRQFVDTVEIGHGMIWGARFQQGDKTYYAIPYIQDGKISYWDEKGNSLRKNLLKAPLKYSRISSRFSGSRLHPILRIRRPHYGVDYAAPSGTPVVAVGDGVVIFKGYSGGGGNTLKIKHNSGSLISGYLHLKGYGPKISNGCRVRQGQLIGYVGTTGLATGPHLDFRLWRNGTPIDPLKVPTEPAEPIHKANQTEFASLRDRIMGELNGTLPDSLRVLSLTPVTDSVSQQDSLQQTVAR